MSSDLTAAGNLAQAIRQVARSDNAQVNEAAAELWGINDKELREIRRSLEELG